MVLSRNLRQEELADRNNALESAGSTNYRRFRAAPSRSDRAARGTAPSLPSLVKLIVIVVLSLGLWGAIWLAVSSTWL
jgi:hypothetical protein